jgi:hypothetical protein
MHFKAVSGHTQKSFNAFFFETQYLYIVMIQYGPVIVQYENLICI